MTSLKKIAIFGACIIVLSGGSVVWWRHREKAIEWKKLSDAASETRARAEQGDAKPQTKVTRRARTASPSCISGGKACRRIMRKQSAGTAKARTRVTQDLN